MKLRFLLLAVLVAVLLGSSISLSGELRCSICGALIPDQAKYFRVKGSQEVFCEKCFSEAPKCSVCKLPTAPADIDPDTGACSRCLAKLPRCKACGRPIVGLAYTFPSAKGVFCAACRSNRPACAICGVPVGEHYWSYPDGRIVCSECGDRAVLDIGAIHRIMQDARQIVERRLGLVVRHPYTVTVEQLSGVFPADQDNRIQAPPGESQLYGNELGKYRRAGDRSEIFLLVGLPPELLYETAAHEYAHAWQAENSPVDLPPELREGFAQWIAAEVLRAKGYRSALEKLEARSDFPYGTGYQRLKRFQQRTILDLLLNGR